MNTTEEVSPETVALAQKLLQKQQVQLEKVREDIKGRHAHALSETLRREPNGTKFQVQISCRECKDTNRWVYSSDLHQVMFCQPCHEKFRKAKRGLVKAQEQAARDAIRAGKIPLPILGTALPAPKGWDIIDGGKEIDTTPALAPLAAESEANMKQALATVDALETPIAEEKSWTIDDLAKAVAGPEVETPRVTEEAIAVADQKKRRGGRPKGSKNKVK